MAEEKLVELLPAKEKKKYMSLNHKTTPGEIAEAEAELANWQRSASVTDENLARQLSREKEGSAGKKLPAVRGSSGSSNAGTGNKDKNSGGDLETKGTGAGANASSAVDGAAADLLALLNANQRRKFEKLQIDLAVTELSLVKRQYKASTLKLQ